MGDRGYVDVRAARDFVVAHIRTTGTLPSDEVLQDVVGAPLLTIARGLPVEERLSFAAECIVATYPHRWKPKGIADKHLTMLWMSLLDLD